MIRVVLVLSLIVASSDLFAGVIGTDESTLRGHERVVVMTSVGPIAEQMGIRGRTLAIYLKEKLEAGAVNVVDDIKKSTAVVALEIQAIDTGPVAVFVCRVRFVQAAHLIVGERAALAATWESVHFGVFSKGKQSLMRSTADQAIADFVKVWATRDQEGGAEEN